MGTNMNVGFNTNFKKGFDSKFVVKNNSTKRTIKIFGMKIVVGATYDLMNIPYVSEADIKNSLLKGELLKKIQQNIITIEDSSIDLVQYNSEFATFLENAGADIGTGDLKGMRGVANVLALTALDIGLYPNGSVISVSTLDDSFILKKTAADTADGITIVNTSTGIGRWFRQQTESKRWLNQSTWYVNASTGDDENDGLTSDEALASLAEFNRRIGTGTVPNFTFLTVETDLNEEVPGFGVTAYTFEGNYKVGLFVQGDPTVLGTGTLTDVTAYDETMSPGITGMIEDTNIPVSWTASGFFSKLIRLTSGSNSGAIGWIIKDLGTKQARFSPLWRDNSFATVTPTIGDDYEILDLITLHGGPIKAAPANGSAIQFNYIHFTKPDLSSNDSNLESVNGKVFTTGCWLEAPHCTQDNGCSNGVHKGSLFDQNGTTYQVRSGQADFYGCCFASVIRSTGTRGNLAIIAPCVIQAGIGGVQPLGVDLRFGGHLSINSGAWLAGFDQTYTVDPVISVHSGSVARLIGKVWGVDWAGRGAWVDTSGSISYSTGSDLVDHLDVAGTAEEIQVGGVSTTYAAIGSDGVFTTNNAIIAPAAFAAATASPVIYPTTSVTTTYAALNINDVILSDATGGSFSVTLPLAAESFKKIIIKKIDVSGNTVTVDGNGAETIDGQLNYQLTLQYESITIISDGTQWFII